LLNRAISWQTIVGYLLALGAAGVVTLYTVLFNTFTDRGIAPKSINIAFMTCLFGGILFLLCTIFYNKLSIGTGIDSAKLTLRERQDICVLLGLGILSTALPFFCYTVAAQRLPIVLAT
jgi:drug/metabolite transporter, DME family